MNIVKDIAASLKEAQTSLLMADIPFEILNDLRGAKVIKFQTDIYVVLMQTQFNYKQPLRVRLHIKEEYWYDYKPEQHSLDLEEFN